MADDKLIEAMARAIAEAYYSGILWLPEAAEYEAKCHWREFVSAATAALAAYRAHQAEAGIVEVPREPTDGLLMSMAIRYDHGLGLPGYYDQPPMQQDGVTHAMRLRSTLTTMRQLHEEVVGTGFYRPATAQEREG